MTISNSTFRSIFTAALFILLAAPSAAFAKVSITNVMYNPPGADAGREWIQLTNTGTAAVDLAGYRLYEGGVNHKLTAAVGTSTLAAGAVAIITTDPGQYLADHPAFLGAIFKSSFSLSNTAETVAIKDASLTVVDSYSYTAPPVVKAPAPAKAAASKTSSKITKTKNTYTNAANRQPAAAAAPLALPDLPAIPAMWLYGLGLLALLILGAGAALYASPASLAATNRGAGEFELE